ncbi:hypothetical protein [Candidatus Viridilinea mediisalina]|uniref:FecR protein domain-containing protein n=1 Tax=Candidatus Viridilinea mediisalina TaxID=2024553 RepID=A0A2A6RH88_9CHLR|nr:hypothetical protein [Candidatus Viridilinea mediisalina]PDW02256.1 hypothetical protein CJ255_14935 [Candidatus Viridilinea mediisalina]
MHLEHTPAARHAAQQRTLNLAWVTLIFFFTLFLILLGWALFMLRQNYQTAMRPLPDGATVIIRERSEWVAWRPGGRTIFQGADDGQFLATGDTLRAAHSAGYGQIASIRLFEESQLDLWAGAELSLEALRTTRWHAGLLEVTLRQKSGYVRYDLKPNQGFTQFRFTVLVGEAQIVLAPGGSYSIDLRYPERAIMRADHGNAFEVDVAVRSGTALITGSAGEMSMLSERERLLIDPAGRLGLPVPARWNLIRDGGFRQYSEIEYNNTTLNDPTAPQSQTWTVYSVPDLPPEQRGYFRLTEVCRPPLLYDCSPDERRTAAWFYRMGGQTTSFTTGIKQELGPHGEGVDISEFRSLRFSVWVRVVYQSLEDTGDRGSECPVMIRLVAKRTSPSDPEEQRDFCGFVDKDQIPPTVTEPGMEYYRLPEGEWALISFDLRAPEKLPDYRYLRRVQIFAQGHDYDSLVTEVSLIGEQ